VSQSENARRVETTDDRQAADVYKEGSGLVHAKADLKLMGSDISNESNIDISEKFASSYNDSVCLESMYTLRLRSHRLSTVVASVYNLRSYSELALLILILSCSSNRV